MTVDELNKEFETYCKGVYAVWSAKAENKLGHMYIWNPSWWWDKMEDRGRRWRSFIYPLCEEWWYQRGYAYWIENSEGNVDNLSYPIKER